MLIQYNLPTDTPGAEVTPIVWTKNFRGFFMNKKHDYAALLKYMRMLEEGYSFIHISDKYGISEKRLKYLWALYQEQGASVLHRKKRTMVDGYLRKEIVLDFEKNDLTLVQGALRYGVSVDCLGDWVRTARREGIDALLISKKEKSMGRPRKKKPEEMTELERLRRENHLLKLELEIRKKAQALVEERKARLRAIGQGRFEN
jgi:transposase